MALVNSHKAIVIEAKGKSAIKDMPMPRLRDHHLLVRITAVAVNPTDWKHIEYGLGIPGAKVGCDFAGIVIEVGSGVGKSLQKGDRVSGFVHGSNASEPEDGAFGEYSVVKEGITMKIPENLNDEEASCIGLGLVTAGQGLYQSLMLPLPTDPMTEPKPILIYGGATATGILAIQFAKLSGLTVVTTCSPTNFEYVKSLGADAAFDYTDNRKCITDIRSYTRGQLQLAFDCVSTLDTALLCAQSLSNEENSHYSGLLKLDFAKAKAANPMVAFSTMVAYTATGETFRKFGKNFEASPDDYSFATNFFELSRRLIEEGKLKPARQSVNQGGKGLEGILKGIAELKEGKVRASKLVYTM